MGPCKQTLKKGVLSDQISDTIYEASFWLRFVFLMLAVLLKRMSMTDGDDKPNKKPKLGPESIPVPGDVEEDDNEVPLADGDQCEDDLLPAEETSPEEVEANKADWIGEWDPILDSWKFEPDRKLWWNLRGKCWKDEAGYHLWKHW